MLASGQATFAASDFASTSGFNPTSPENRGRRDNPPASGEFKHQAHTRLCLGSILVRTPVNTNSGQRTLGRGRNGDLPGPHVVKRVVISEQVSGFPRCLQVGCRASRIDGSTVSLACLKGPLVNGGVLLTAVIENTATLGLFAGFDKARDRESG